MLPSPGGGASPPHSHQSPSGGSWTRAPYSNPHSKSFPKAAGRDGYEATERDVLSDRSVTVASAPRSRDIEKKKERARGLNNNVGKSGSRKRRRRDPASEERRRIFNYVE